jgi:hypothetical protein
MDSEELAVLIAEQERDMRRGHRVYSLSITEFVDNVVDGNGVLGAFLGSPYRWQRPPTPLVPPSREARNFHQYRKPVAGFCMALIQVGRLTG